MRSKGGAPQDSGFRVEGFGLKMSGVGCRVKGLVVRQVEVRLLLRLVLGSWLRIEGVVR